MTAEEIDRAKWLWTFLRRDQRTEARASRRLSALRGQSSRLASRAGDGLFPSETGVAMTTGGVATALYNRRNRMPSPRSVA